MDWTHPCAGVHIRVHIPCTGQDGLAHSGYALKLCSEPLHLCITRLHSAHNTCQAPARTSSSPH